MLQVVERLRLKSSQTFVYQEQSRCKYVSPILVISDLRDGGSLMILGNDAEDYQCVKR